jgi:hypothetical protein
LPLCLVLLAWGCTRHSVEHVEVSGQVLLPNGKPMPGGEVTFTTADGFASVGVVDEKGNYKISAPVGDVKVSVTNQMLNPAAKGGGKAAGRGAGRPGEPEPSPVKGTYIPINKKYFTPDTSGLTYKVTKGAQTYDIKLPE